jgi:hypothetical protein
VLRVHFKNLDSLRHAPHSMHFHGVHYAPKRAPDREFEVVFSPFGKSFMAIDGRAFVSNTLALPRHVEDHMMRGMIGIYQVSR